MFTPSSAADDGLPDLNAVHHLPLPLIVLSSQRTVLIATEAVKRLLAWSPGHQWHPRSLVGCPLAQLGISLSPDQDRDEQDLNTILDQIAYMKTNDAASSAHHSEPTRGRKRRKIKEQDTDMLPTVGDTVYETWPEDDWCGTPVLEVLVDLQRGHQGRRLVRAKLSVRMWVTDEAPLYVLVFAKPTSSPNPGQSFVPAQMSEKDARKAKKLATLAKMKSAVFDQASIPTYLFSADETIYYPNQAGQALCGHLQDDCMLENGYQILSRLNIWDETFTRKLEVAEYPSIKLVRTRQSFKEHKYGVIYPHTGKRVRLDLSGDCLYDEGTGEFLGGVVWCRDVTEYAEVIAQQQLEIERGFESKLDNMPNLSWTARPDGEPDYFSKRWYDYTGASRLDTFKDIWTRTVHPDERDAMWDSWIQCTMNGQPFTREARYKRFDGMYRYQLVHGEPQLDERGNIVRWHGVCTDIHDLVMRRLDASRLKQQMITVLSHAEVNLFGFNPQMEVTMLEGSMKWGTQESASEKKALVGGEFTDIVDKTSNDGAKGAADVVEALQKILRGDSTMEVLEHSLDKRWYKTRIIADVDTGEEGGQGTVRGAIGLSIDVTDMKARATLEMEKTQLVASELAAKEANMLKSQFLANVSHELRTPISGVLGMAELLRETPLADEQREYTRGISQSADNLLSLVNDILDASKIEAGRFDIESVEFDLSGVVGDLYKMMTYAAQRKGLTLEYKTSLARIEPVIGDPGRTRQVLLNLLTNAVKFTNKGSIILSVSTSESEDVLAVFFTVEDTGIGIEDAVLRKLFRPFSQGDSSTARLFGGTGLGLTICKELAALMHGSIKLESKPNVGSKATFSVQFNRGRSSTSVPGSSGTQILDTTTLNTIHVPDPEASPLQRTSPGAGDGVILNGIQSELSKAARARTQVLVVEDNAINQNYAVQIIRRLGFPVQAVWNGRDALEYLANPTAATPRPHIILMDCQMPIMDGYETTRRLRNSADVSIDASLRKIPVIALTASAIKGDKEKCEAAGMDDYITKPVAKQDLERVLVRWALRT